MLTIQTVGVTIVVLYIYVYYCHILRVQQYVVKLKENQIYQGKKKLPSLPKFHMNIPSGHSYRQIKGR